MEEKPAPCDPKIFSEGMPIVALHARSWAAEHWVRSVAKESGVQVDWHYSGGIANVLYLGGDKERERVVKAINKLEGTLEGAIWTRFEKESPGLYRRGVTETPKGALGAYSNPGDQESTIL